MKDLKLRAQRLLLEIEAIQTGDFENRNSDLLTLINEALRDAAYLAADVIEDHGTEDKDAA